jgi:hypothetical protein
VDTIAQLDLFSTRIVPIGQKRGSIVERFREFHKLNTHVYLAFVLVAREWIEETGSTKVGAKAVWEQLRWRFGKRTKRNSDYALDNSYTAYYARLAAQQEPDLADAFEFRKLRSVA